MILDRITPTAEEAAKLEELMKAPYPVTLATIGKKLEMTELEAARRLPEGIVRFVSGDVKARFEEIWAALAAWEKATLFIIHEGHVFEIAAKLSKGKCARGYYNVMAKDAVVGGHIAYEKVSAVAFMAMPFMGRESLSVQFFDENGKSVFSVYAGRENHQIIDSVKTAFAADRDALCA